MTFCRCLKFLILLRPTGFQSWKMGAAVFLPASTLDICLNQAVWKGRFCSCVFADMYSVNSVFHHFEKSIPVDLQHTFAEGGTHRAHAFISCTGARAEQQQGRNRRVLTQELLLHNQHSNRAQVHKERRSYTNHRHLCGLLQPQHYHKGNPGSWLQLTIF